MPHAAYQACRFPRCAGYAVRDGYCPAHESMALPAKRWRVASPVYHGQISYTSVGYRAMRRAFLNRHPLCVECHAPATELDHVRPHRGNVALFWDQGNWQGLCKRCHDRKTAREAAGGR
jgi:5-methylcytosine-specific restriction enzyme A